VAGIAKREVFPPTATKSSYTINPTRRLRDHRCPMQQASGAQASEPVLMIVLLLFLQKQSLAFAVYLFGIGTLHTGPGLKKKKKNTCDNALTMTSPVHW
jgi:hypothetical protein